MTFRRYAVERVAAFAALLFVAVSITYVAFHVLVDQERPTASELSRLADPKEAAARYAHYADLSFGDYLWRLIGHGSLGIDRVSGTSLTLPIAKVSLVTLSVVLGTLIVALLIALPIGVAWARHPGIARRPAAAYVYLALGVAPVAIGIHLAYLVGYKGGVLPISGYCDVFSPAAGECGGFGDWAEHLVLPSLTLGLPLAALYIRTVRSLVRDVAHASGTATEAERPRAVREARRTASLVFAKRMLLDLGWLVGVAAFAEHVFSLHGLGWYLVGHVDPLSEGVLVFASLLTLGLYVIIDLAAAAASRDWRSIRL